MSASGKSNARRGRALSEAKIHNTAHCSQNGQSDCTARLSVFNSRGGNKTRKQNCAYLYSLVFKACSRQLAPRLRHQPRDIEASVGWWKICAKDTHLPNTNSVVRATKNSTLHHVRSPDVRPNAATQHPQGSRTRRPGHYFHTMAYNSSTTPHGTD